MESRRRTPALAPGDRPPMLLRLAWKNLRRDRLRSSLTILAIAVATFAFLLLQTVVSSWSMDTNAKSSVLLSRQRVSFLMRLPIRLVDQVRQIQGVTAATPMLFFGGRIVGREEEDFLGLAIEPNSFLDVYSDHLTLPPADKDCWLSNRDGVIVGQRMADDLHLQRGQRFSLVSGFAGVSTPIPFQVCGIYGVNAPGVDDESAFLRFAYVNEYLPAPRKDEVTLLVSRVAPGQNAAVVAKRIDDHFDTTDSPTLTQDESAFAKGFLAFLRTVLRAITLINGVLLGLIGLIVGNAIAMSVRERTSEYGTLRALGFSPVAIFAMIAAEASILCFVGGLLAVVVAFPLVNGLLGPAIEAGSNGMFTTFRLTTAPLGITLAAAALLGLLAATPPALRALRIRTVDAIRSIG